MEKIDLKEFTLYRSVFKYLNSNMYILIENNNAIIIDPNPNEYAIELLKNNNVSKVTIILSHEHRDHVYGIYLFQENFETKIIATKACAEYISKKENSRPVIISFILEEYDRNHNTNLLKAFNEEYVPRTYSVDLSFQDKLSFKWQNHSLNLFTIQGHSKGSCVIIIDEKYIFTGDTLLKDFPVIVRFPGGNKNFFKNITLPFLEQILKFHNQIFPGHGAPFIAKEIMQDKKINVWIK